MKLHIVILLVSLSLIGCNDKTADAGDYAFIGGEIVNPNNDYIMLYNPKAESDTLHLDQHNRFSFKVKDLTPGIYTFTHGGEYQMLLLEVNDSIMFRLNTVDFDESLVYTGLGAKKNNFLIKTFLDNEIDNKKLTKYCQMEPEDFMKHVDSSMFSRIQELDKFIQHKSPSDLFIKIAKTSINYNYYANKEIYPFGYYGNNKLIHFKDLPEGFYDFRNEVDYNMEDLNEFYVYNRFLFSHFNNLALEKYYSVNGHDTAFDRESLAYNLGKLDLIDSLIVQKKIKNYLLKHTARDFIIHSLDKEEIDSILSSYTSKCTNSEDKSEIVQLVASIEKLQTGYNVPNVAVVNYNGKTTDLHSIISRPTVIYFWSSNFKMNYRNSHSKVKKLKAKYPTIDFIAINVNDDDEMYWKKTLEKFNFPTENEYQFKEPTKAHNSLVVNSVSKVIIVNKNMTIIDANTNMFTSKFEEHLKKLNK
ncbi:hypothetical protein A9Q87_00490 [Flavobacteriales bacterium 34_180_T64]|nr:hypothetical protein A9Q87_00490 [Flavobacteriales bacterium 34_180_T64]